MEVIRCPKCDAPMHTRRRNGVTIEQCIDCHGIFLDRGELEQLIGAESSFLGADPPERHEAGFLTER
jgi:Zn-finger nucleic acid-binding protein